MTEDTPWIQIKNPGGLGYLRRHPLPTGVIYDVTTDRTGFTLFRVRYGAGQPPILFVRILDPQFRAEAAAILRERLGLASEGAAA